MPSLKFPDTGTRYVELPNGRPAVNARGYLYADEELTVPAEVYYDTDGTRGSLIPTDEEGRRSIVLDAHGRQVDYWGPQDGTAELWIVINGVASRVNADYNPRLAEIAAQVGTIGGSLLADAAADATAKANAVLAEAVQRGNHIGTQPRTTITGLGDAASRNVGDTAGTVAAGDDSRLTGAAQKSANLSDLDSSATARTNLGLGNVDNTADAAKPVSTAAQAALNAKAPIADPTFTGTVNLPAGTTTKPSLKVPSGAAPTTPVDGDVWRTSQGVFTRDRGQPRPWSEDIINVRAFGAVGDCTHVDQRVSSGTFGLPGATPTDANTFGRGFQDTGFTIPATDNTTAFRAAWDALMNLGRFALLQRSTGAVGYRSLRWRFHIPAGAYYISDAAALFSTLRTNPPGNQTGVDITGDGFYNTILFVRIPTAAAADYLFYDNNHFHGMSMHNVTIVCTTGTERLVYQLSAGHSKRWRFTECHFRDYKTFLEIGGTVNADIWTFNNCNWVTNVAGATVMTNQTNAQAISFDFISPSITHLAGGDVFNIGAGGHIRIWGGNTDIYGLAANGAAGRFAYVHGDGTTLGNLLVPVLTVNDHKFELQQDAGLCDIGWNMVIFRDCNAPPLSNTRWANGLKHHIVVRGRGSIVWDGGHFGDMYLALSTDPLVDYSWSIKAHATIRNAWIENNDWISTRVGWFTNAGDGLTTSFHSLSSGATASGAGIGRLQVEDCHPLSAQYATLPTTNLAVNGSPYNAQSWFGRPSRVNRVTHRAGSALAFGLPNEGNSAVIRIPIGCQVLRVGIVKQVAQSGIGTNSRTWKVTDGNGTVVSTLTTTGTTSNVNTVSADLYRTVATTNDGTFTLTCDPTTPASTGTGAEGFYFVDYI